MKRLLNKIRFYILRYIYNITLRYVEYYEGYTRHVVVVRDREKAILLQHSYIIDKNTDKSNIKLIEDNLLESVRHYINHHTIDSEYDNMVKHTSTITIFNNK